MLFYFQNTHQGKHLQSNFSKVLKYYKFTKSNHAHYHLLELSIILDRANVYLLSLKSKQGAHLILQTQPHQVLTLMLEKLILQLACSVFLCISQNCVLVYASEHWDDFDCSQCNPIILNLSCTLQFRSWRVELLYFLYLCSVGFICCAFVVTGFCKQLILLMLSTPAHCESFLLTLLWLSCSYVVCCPS